MNKFEIFVIFMTQRKQERKAQVSQHRKNTTTVREFNVWHEQ